MRAFFYAPHRHSEAQIDETADLAAKILGCFKPYPDLSLL
jgi:hypothetical protein